MDRANTELITFHGWGFSPNVWEGWESILPSAVRFIHADRGYFGPPCKPSFSESSGRKVLLTHSFGLHWCPAGLLAEADHLVVLSGFLDFHPAATEENRRSRLVLRQMLSRFVEKPGEVLRMFYKNAFSPDKVTSEEFPGTFNHDNLLSDLDILGTSRLNPEKLLRVPGITFIHGEADEVVSNTKGRSMYADLQDNSQYFEIKQAGHCVPFTHAEQCYRFLKPALGLHLGKRIRNT
ncbi:MAG: alpha/beta hydrolase [Balneolaceae bacterium]